MLILLTKLWEQLHEFQMPSAKEHLVVAFHFQHLVVKGPIPTQYVIIINFT